MSKYLVLQRFIDVSVSIINALLIVQLYMFALGLNSNFVNIFYIIVLVLFDCFYLMNENELINCLNDIKELERIQQEKPTLF